jgi:hypothetical protein
MFAIGDKDWPGLSKVTEETGELMQVIGRLMATHGDHAHWSGSDLKADYLKEVADVAAAVEFVVGFLTPAERSAVSRRKQEKLNLFCHWHNEEIEKNGAGPATWEPDAP